MKKCRFGVLIKKGGRRNEKYDSSFFRLCVTSSAEEGLDDQAVGDDLDRTRAAVCRGMMKRPFQVYSDPPSSFHFPACTSVLIEQATTTNPARLEEEEGEREGSKEQMQTSIETERRKACLATRTIG